MGCALLRWSGLEHGWRAVVKGCALETGAAAGPLQAGVGAVSETIEARSRG